MHFRRRPFICLAAAISVAGAGTAFFMTGCEGLDYSAHSEGTGVQIFGAIAVLAKYHASPHQKAVAESQARAVFAQAAQPEYEKRRVAIHSHVREKKVAVEETYNRRVAVARKQPEQPVASPPAPSKPNAPAPPTVASKTSVAVIESEKQEALRKLERDAAAEINALDQGYRSLGGAIAASSGTAPAAPSESVPDFSTRDREALVASAAAHVPEYIAISVPPQGIAAEQGGKATVMLWNTRLQRLASEDVLVLDRRPAEGKTAKVDGVAAKFVSNF